MPRTVSASEAKTQFGAIMEWTTRCKDDVIVESHGKPKAVIVSFEEYQKMAELREKARRQELLAQLQKLREETLAETGGMSEEEALALGDRLTREAIDRMIADGRVKYGGE